MNVFLDGVAAVPRRPRRPWVLQFGKRLARACGKVL
jgi:hypothetical protein